MRIPQRSAVAFAVCRDSGTLPLFNSCDSFPLRRTPDYRVVLPEPDDEFFMRIVPDRTSKRSGPARLWMAGFALMLAAAVVVTLMWRSQPQTRSAAPVPVPVTVAPVAQQDVPIFFQALGTVQASYTVSVRSQIDGKLQSVDFVEGQAVH